MAEPSLLDKLYNSCLSLSRKATQGMRTILKRKLIPPTNPRGILSRLELKSKKDKTNQVITLETDFPPYTPYVDEGRKRGKMPPYDKTSSLYEWCRRHTYSKNGKTYTTEQSAFLVARKIAKKGTEGKHFLTPINRMVGMLSKAVSTTAKVSVQSQYKDVFYTNMLTIKEIKFDL